MTRMADVYMLSSDTILDTRTVSEIVKSGYTRIPVYEADRDHIVAILNVKDLVLLDPDDKIPLKTICQFYQHPVRVVMEDTPLNAMLEEFKKGHYHVAMVQCINDSGEGDPVYEIIGLVTLEDIIEEIIQSEIMDETDVLTDNRRRVRRLEAQMKDFGIFTQGSDRLNVSPQLAMATYQYLSTTLEPFKSNHISDQVLLRLIKQNVNEIKPADRKEEPKVLYTKGKPADYFVLLLEGMAEVTIGEEGMLFEAGPFHYFGLQALTKVAAETAQLSPAELALAEERQKATNFVPDFTMKATQKVLYLCVRSSTYLNAIRASYIEREKSNPEIPLLESPDASGV
jgi:metal transporter CNNM